MLDKFKFKAELKLPTLFLTIPFFLSPYSEIPLPFNFIFSILDLLHFRLFLSFVTHLSSIVNKFSSTLFSALDDTSTVELSLKLDEVLNWLLCPDIIKISKIFRKSLENISMVILPVGESLSSVYSRLITFIAPVMELKSVELELVEATSWSNGSISWVGPKPTYFRGSKPVHQRYHFSFIL